MFQLTIVVLPKFLSKNFFFLKFTQTVFFLLHPVRVLFIRPSLRKYKLSLKKLREEKNLKEGLNFFELIGLAEELLLPTASSLECDSRAH